MIQAATRKFMSAPFRQNKVCRIMLFALCVPWLMGAEVYRWVDENGVVNYTQNVPRGVKAQRITTQAGAPSVIAEVEEVSEDTEPETPPLTDEQKSMLDELKAAELARQQELARIRQTNCEQAREILANLSLTSRIRVRNPDGTQRVMGEDERQRRIEEAQQGIVTNCGAADAG
ncbi:MAG: DUF4124 domain-containing protein [Gammaproteobacteria bacterium]|nr:DUF4124 domain-containing protein [Gammaproteobacteria bacterium]